MFYKLLLLTCFVLALGTAAAFTQTAADPFVPGEKKDEAPRGIQEALIKMRIDKEKKDFNEMLKRGDDVVKLAEKIDDSQTARTLTSEEKGKVSEIGKLVKKIREELGGDDDADKESLPPESTVDALKALKDSVNALSEELKKSSRFTVSAAAIDRTNEILRLVQYLRG
ncbi:MAG TPA: hypothetical protein VGO43_00905 [Pyrinomonadaceae bacterium]|nr:hypothetical protein [Pyrinomonadaceae bacterium]